AVGSTPPLPSPSSSAAGNPSASPDAAAAVLIGTPYLLVDNPKNKVLTESFAFRFDVAGQLVESTMSGREIRQDSTLVGLVLVMNFGGLKMTDDVFDAAANATATNSGGKVAFTTILGKRVAFVTTKDSTFGMYGLGDAIVMVGGPTGTDARTLLTSVITANK
ncbi:MAG: hypothetical protein QOI09_1686, partial [Chloroflexota bacterium]|nr:hypothetical protein [Chloroflexota bacterium]